jgi:hypothetical protein
MEVGNLEANVAYVRPMSVDTKVQQVNEGWISHTLTWTSSSSNSSSPTQLVHVSTHLEAQTKKA